MKQCVAKSFLEMVCVFFQLFKCVLFEHQNKHDTIVIFNKFMDNVAQIKLCHLLNFKIKTTMKEMQKC